MSICFTTEDVITAMAPANHPIEIHNDHAYLVVGKVTWIAPLAPVGGAA